MPAGVLEYLWFRDNDPWWATLLRAVALIALVVLFVIKGMQSALRQQSVMDPVQQSHPLPWDTYDPLATQSTGVVRPKWLVLA